MRYGQKLRRSGSGNTHRAFIFGSFADGMGLSFLSLIQDIERAAGLVVDVITTRQALELESKFGYEITKKARMVYERAED